MGSSVLSAISELRARTVSIQAQINLSPYVTPSCWGSRLLRASQRYAILFRLTLLSICFEKVRDRYCAASQQDV